MHSNGKVIKK